MKLTKKKLENNLKVAVKNLRKAEKEFRVAKALYYKADRLLYCFECSRSKK